MSSRILISIPDTKRYSSWNTYMYTEYLKRILPGIHFDNFFLCLNNLIWSKYFFMDLKRQNYLIIILIYLMILPNTFGFLWAQKIFKEYLFCILGNFRFLRVFFLYSEYLILYTEYLKSIRNNQNIKIILTKSGVRKNLE